MKTFLQRWATLNTKEKSIVIISLLLIIGIIGVGVYVFSGVNNNSEKTQEIKEDQNNYSPHLSLFY